MSTDYKPQSNSSTNPPKKHKPHSKTTESGRCASCRIDVPDPHLTKTRLLGWLCRFCLGKLVKIWPKRWL